jgi:hypothetical protein
MNTALTPIEQPYLTLERPVIVYQRAGGLIAVPFDLDGAPHVVTVRVDPLDDSETVALIPACSHDTRATLAAFAEALDALEDVRDRAQVQGRVDAVRLSERALAALRREGQVLGETRAQVVPRVTAYPGRRTQRHESRVRAYA